MSACGKTLVGGWHCEGTGCLDAGRVCMHDAAAPRGVASVTLEGSDSIFATGGLMVGREALGLEPSAADLIGKHRRRMLDALNGHYRREMERMFLPPFGLPAPRPPESGADCG